MLFRNPPVFFAKPVNFATKGLSALKQALNNSMVTINNEIFFFFVDPPDQDGVFGTGRWPAIYVVVVSSGYTILEVGIPASIDYHVVDMNLHTISLTLQPIALIRPQLGPFWHLGF